MTPDITKLRRFALSIGLILFFYAIAGVELDVAKSITPLGIPLVIKRPNLLGICLVVASIYAAVRYWYYSTIVSISPASARKFLRSGLFPLGTGKDLRGDTALRHEQAALIFGRYFPRMGIATSEITVKQTTDLEGTRFSGVEIPTSLPWRTRMLIWLENLDYAAPVWVNIIAITLYFVMR